MDLRKTYLEKLKERATKYSANPTRNSSANKQVLFPPISSTPSEPRTSINEENESSTFELMTLMTKRLKLLEKKCRLQETEIDSKKKELKMLRNQLGNVTQDRNQLSEKYEEIKTQIDEMETFLADYGLAWVGEEGDKRKSLLCPLFLNEKSSVLDTSDIENYYDNIIRALSKINESLFSHNVESIPVYIYSNGIQISSKPFRSYYETEALEFISDVIEGYFPAEFHQRYPSGCTFEIFDRRNFSHSEERKSNIVDFSYIEDNKNDSSFKPMIFNSQNGIFKNYSRAVDIEQGLGSGITNLTRSNKHFLELLTADQIALKVNTRPPKFMIFSKSDKLRHVCQSIASECKLSHTTSIHIASIGKIGPTEQSLQDIGITYSTVVHVSEDKY